MLPALFALASPVSNDSASPGPNDSASPVPNDSDETWSLVNTALATALDKHNNALSEPGALLSRFEALSELLAALDAWRVVTGQSETNITRGEQLDEELITFMADVNDWAERRSNQLDENFKSVLIRLNKLIDEHDAPLRPRRQRAATLNDSGI